MGARQSARPQRDTLIAGVTRRTGSVLGSGPSPFLRLSSRPTVAGVRTCDFCGRQEPDDATTLAWTTAVERGRQRTYCDTCSRDHLRAMEGKLDSEWW